MNKEYPYSYNIAPDFDLKAFYAVTTILDSGVGGSLPQELVKDYDFDGSMLKIYGRPGREIRVYCDWDIGAVFIDSDIDLDDYFGERRLRS